MCLCMNRKKKNLINLKNFKVLGFQLYIRINSNILYFIKFQNTKVLAFSLYILKRFKIFYVVTFYYFYI